MTDAPEPLSPKARKQREEETRRPHYVFHMEGSPHYTEAETACCGHAGKTCECGGYLHYQPVHEGYYHKCERCLTEV